MLYSTIRHNMIWYDTLRCATVRCKARLGNTTKYNAPEYNTITIISAVTIAIKLAVTSILLWVTNETIETSRNTKGASAKTSVNFQRRTNMHSMIGTSAFFFEGASLSVQSKTFEHKSVHVCICFGSWLLVLALALEVETCFINCCGSWHVPTS